MKVTIAANLFSSSGDGFDYTANLETVTVRSNVSVGSEFSEGLYSLHAHSALINRGHITGGDFGVLFDGANATITNVSGGLIGGAYGGIEMDGAGEEICYNLGKAIGANGDGVDLGGGTLHHNSLVLLNNHGSAIGQNDGVSIVIANEIDAVAGVINNFNTIRGGSYGISVVDYAHKTTVINNFAGGTIEGTNAAIKSYYGGLTLSNYGKIIGDVVGDAARAVIVNHGTITGAVHLGHGNSYFNGTGGTSGTIYAEGGNDRIIAGNGNVFIHLGTGNDTVTAGPGHDLFFFDDTLSNSVDKITNFAPGHDKMVLSESGFVGIGPLGGTLAANEFHVGAHAQTMLQYIIYNPNTGFLFYDTHDGSPEIHFATIGAHLALSHNNFLVEA